MPLGLFIEFVRIRRRSDAIWALLPVAFYGAGREFGGRLLAHLAVRLGLVFALTRGPSIARRLRH